LALRKSPTLARRITEDFPRLDVLHCYTHPITSESEGTGTRGLESLWRKRADVAKIAHVCELYFEWGVEEKVIKRFRSFLWPGAVLRTLLQTALEKDNRDGAGVVTPSKRGEGGVETPSKALARTLGGLALSADSDDDNDNDNDNDNDSDNDNDNDNDNDIKLITAIHGERRHASTDNTLEYRLEIDPRELVARARSGIQGLRQELEDSAAAGGLDDDDDEDDDDDGEDDKKKKRGVKTPPPDPDSKLRLWMPAVMVQYACPGLVRDFLERMASKQAKKSKKGKTTKDKVRRKEEEEVEVDEESATAKPVRSKKAKDMFIAGKAKVPDECGASNDDDPPPISKFRPSTAGKPAVIPVKPSQATATASGPSGSGSQPKSATQLLDEDLFWTSSQSLPHNSKPRTKQAHADAERPLIPRPFPLDLDDLFTEPNHASSPIPAPSRKYSSSSASSGDLDLTHAPLKKSHRKSTKHSSPRVPSRPLSPSPHRSQVSSQMKPLHRAMARSAASKAAALDTADDEVIVISSDSDESPPPKTKARAKLVKNNSDNAASRKVLAPSNLNYLDSEVIDLT
jgi:holliday junction resolvase GEN1/YEN1